jgi:hypothetical protein
MSMRTSVRVRRIAAALAAAGALSIALVAIARSPVPATIGHQGRLFDTAGTPITARLRVTFRIFNQESGGDPIWFEDREGVNFADGYYSLMLGEVTPLPDDVLVDEAGTEPVQRWLEVVVDGEALTPRAKMCSVPYARFSQDVTGDIHPRSVIVNGKEVIDSEGNVQGGAKGDQGDPGLPGPSGVVLSVSAMGAGVNPTSSLGFVSPPITVTVTGVEDVLVTAHKALGSIQPGGGAGLTLNVCHQPEAGGALTPVDPTGISGLRVPPNTRIVQSMSARIPKADLPTGAYNVGLCAISSSPLSWNDNGWGATTASVVRVP